MIHNDIPKDDPLQRKPDIRLVKDMLNWELHTSLDKGLDETIKFFMQQIV